MAEDDEREIPDATAGIGWLRVWCGILTAVVVILGFVIWNLSNQVGALEAQRDKCEQAQRNAGFDVALVC